MVLATVIHPEGVKNSVKHVDISIRLPYPLTGIC